MFSAPSNFKAMIQNWATLAANILLDGEELTNVDHFSPVGICVMREGRMAVEMSTCLSKGRSAYARLNHLRRPSDIFLFKSLRALCRSMLSFAVCLKETEFVCRRCSLPVSF